MASDVPDVFADGVRFHITAFAVSMTFSMSPPGNPSGEPATAVNVRTSREHSKAMAIILRKQLKIYEDGNGAPIHLHPNVWKSLGLSKHDDW
jgi:hypothetical protein